MTTVSIERLDPANVAASSYVAGDIAAIVGEINAAGGDNALPAQMSADDVLALIERLGERGGLFVCRERGGLAGFATVTPDEQQPGTAVMGVWIRPSFRRRGLGTELARSGVEFARDQGYAKLRGTIPGENQPALSFFSSVGPIVQVQTLGGMGYELPV